MLLRTRIRNCDIFKKSELRKIWMALYLSISVIINVKINWWTEDIFLLIYYHLTTCISEDLDQLCPNHNSFGTLHIFNEQKFRSIKHQIHWEAAIIMWSRIIPSVQALTLRPHWAGYKMANTCGWAHVHRCLFPLFSSQPVFCAGGRNGQGPSHARETFSACRRS